MKTGSYDFNWSSQLISELLKKPLSFRFRQPVDPVKDGAPNYLEIVKNPIDLSAIKAKLQAESYNSVNEVIDDIDLIYKNSVLFNGEKDLLTYIAKDISSYAHTKLSEKCSSRAEENIKKIERIMNEINEHIKCQPPRPTPLPKEEKTKIKPKAIEIPPQPTDVPQIIESHPETPVVKQEQPAETVKEEKTAEVPPEKPVETATELPKVSESQPTVEIQPQPAEEITSSTQNTNIEPATQPQVAPEEKPANPPPAQETPQENPPESSDNDLPVLVSSTVVQSPPPNQ
ncbi:Bromodomain containing protein [Trichomonas vaginalis G3]|uniref:Bromodomain containing protein n=1 Tax=Trichomonas vaginalis (strain ATCC PRA-98 / G3) TaxID=412133 RepID=A2ERN9_TRIV3|nr:acetylation-dependent protein binding [Trichomonas vaginalis G3]EAY04691.1 Bromodomain containing protein [Trichomonas vaginalis G3]KAI5530899.1 acetylation-dependent protein binding [Trichomonas vaginalis G3]|eukprot:XP_001316914.1 Bromodomain containing protein [Trichomonas vaginalis G3]